MKTFLAILLSPSLLYAGTCHLVDHSGNGIRLRMHTDEVTIQDCLNEWWSLKPSDVKRTYIMRDDVVVFERKATNVELDFHEESEVHYLRITGTRKY